jgi:hypothetical protein
MHTTMHLLNDALAIKDLSAWASDLGLSQRVLYTSKYREHLSPAVAGAIARALGQPVEKWVCIAALESEKDSACKRLLIKEAGRSWLHS